MNEISLQKITLGGGCHWCTEAVFQALKGVAKTQQGFAKSEPPYHSWSEAVAVFFDPAAIPLAALIEIHVRTHASTAQHSMRNKYRSAVYSFSKVQSGLVRRELSLLLREFDKPLITKVLPLVDFKSSDERFHNYYLTDPDRPFCKTYIDPKLTKLRRDFGNFLPE